MGKSLFRRLMLLLSAILSVSCYGYSANLQEGVDYVPGEVIVKYKTPTSVFSRGINVSSLDSVKSLSTSLSKQNLEVEDTMSQGNLVVVSIQDDKTVEETIDLLEKNKSVEYAEPNYIYYVQVIDTNDSYTGNLWGLDNYGQYIYVNFFDGIAGTSGEDIDWVNAWQIFSGSFSNSETGILVGIIDEGVNYNHEDLINSMWINKGYDFVNNDSNPIPAGTQFDPHGTHIAGTIAAEINNSKGIIGVNPNAKIMSLKVGNGIGGFPLNLLIEAINYATDNGVKIINASFGGYNYSTGQYEAIARFRDAGGLFITSAGNDGSNNDVNPEYPCAYDLDNIMCVAATTQAGRLASFSNYGIDNVDLGAPGVNIYSTIIDNNLSYTFYYRAVYFVVLLDDLRNAGWEFSGYLYIDNHYEPIWIDENYTTNGTYIQSKLIDTTEAGTSDIGIKAKILCKNENSIDWVNLYVDTGNGWHNIQSYSDGYYDNYYNIGKASSLRYKFSLVDIDMSTGFKCGIYGVELSTFGTSGDYQGPNDLYGYMNGTSMATPHVVGLASLAWSFRPDLNYIDIKNAILENGDTLPSLIGKTVSGKRINAYKTLYALDNYSPEKPTLLSPINGYYDLELNFPLYISFEWSASHDTGVGVSGYKFELSTNNSFNTLLTGIILDDTGLNFDIMNTGIYYWRVKAFDKKGNTGGYSDTYLFSIGQSLPCMFNGIMVNHGESVTAYSTNTVPYGQTCQSQIRICTNGILDGTYEYSSCVVGQPSPCMFNGNMVNHGESVTAYMTNSVQYGETCESQIRTCTNGILDGTYGYSNCTVGQPSPCILDGKVVNHGESVTAYWINTVPYGYTCDSQLRTCTNGVLNGTYQYSNCTVGQPSSCAFNGNIVNHGGTVTAYRTDTVSYGQTCQSQIRTCSNGTLDGTYEYSNCTVQGSTLGGGGGGGGGGNGGGGGGGIVQPIDTPIDTTDYSDTNIWDLYDKESTDSINIDGNLNDVLSNGFTRELNEAYVFAYKNGITTMKSIEQADIYGNLTRIAMAKMLSQYAINILRMVPDFNNICHFNDISDELDRQYNNGALLACHLGIMGKNMPNNRFRPYDLVTRAEFGTALSRLLYNTSDGDDVYYSTHLQLLNRLGIISNTDPKLRELRGYVMLMLMRSSN